MLGLAKSNLCYFGWTVESERNAYHPYPAAGVDLARTDPIQTFYVGVAPRRERDCAGGGDTNLAAMSVAGQLQIHLDQPPQLINIIRFMDQGPADRLIPPGRKRGSRGGVGGRHRIHST